MRRILHFFPIVEPHARASLVLEQQSALKSRIFAAEAAARVGIEVHYLGIATSDFDDIMAWGSYDQIVCRSTAADLDLAFPPLPLLGPLIENVENWLETSEPFDLIIYSNSDIGLYPDGYSRIWELSKSGNRGGSITRRSLPEELRDSGTLARILREPGEPHKGSDLFFFPQQYISDLNFSNMALGVPPIGQVFAYHLFLSAKEFQEFRHEFVSFHLGNESFWRTDSKLTRLWRHNRGEAKAILGNLGSNPYESWGRFVQKVNKLHLLDVDWAPPPEKFGTKLFRALKRSRIFLRGRY